VDRRRIMLVSDTLRAVIVLGFVAAANAGALPLLYVLAFAQASIGTFFSPARGALIPRVVPAEGLLAASSMAQVSRIVGGVVGTGLAGVIVGIAGVVWPAFIVDALTFLASVALVLRTRRDLGRIDPTGATHGEGILASVGTGLRAIGRSRALLGTMVAISVTMLGLGAVNVLFVPFLLNELSASPVWAGPLEGAQTLSMILAGGVVAVLSRRFSTSTLVTGCLLGVAVVIVGLSFTPNVAVLAVVLFAIGWFVTPLQAAVTALLQQRTADAVRGRVLAALNAATSTTTIVSTAAAGIFADALGIRTVFRIGAGIVFLAAVVAWVLLRSERAEAAQPAAEEWPADAPASAA